MAYYRKRAGGWRAEIAILGVRASETWPTKSQAVAWATETETRIRSEHSSGKKQVLAKLTVHSLVDQYIERRLPEKKGAQHETTRLRRFQRELAWIGELASSITQQQHIATWRDARLGEVSPASVNRELNLLSAVFAYGQEINAIAENPVRGIRRPRNPPPRDRDITQPEIDAMLYALGYTCGSHPERVLHHVAMAFLFAIETGMRAGEIIGLTWPRINIVGRYASLPDTKNGDSRQVPLSTAAIDLLKLLPHDDNKPCFRVTAGSLDALWRKYRKRAISTCPSVADLNFHDSRHAAITRLARRLDPLDLARMIGHRDLNSLMIYYNASATDIAGRLG